MRVVGTQDGAVCVQQVRTVFGLAINLWTGSATSRCVLGYLVSRKLRCRDFLMLVYVGILPVSGGAHWGLGQCGFLEILRGFEV